MIPKGWGMAHQVCWEALVSSSPSISQNVAAAVGALALRAMSLVKSEAGSLLRFLLASFHCCQLCSWMLA